MIKKILAVVFAAAMVFCFTACGSSEPAEAPEDEAMSGGWEVVEEPDAAELPDEVQAAFADFEKNYGDDLIPMAYYGYQVVEGMNYGLLCKSKEDNELCTLVMHENTNGHVDDAIINTFDIADYTGDDGVDVTAEPVDGGWMIADDYTTAEIPKEEFEAYDAATQQFVGNDLHPMAYLGSQVVAGTNYAFLCHSTTVTADPVSSIQVVTVYEDLEGNCEILNICTLDLASFAEDE